MKFKKGDRVKLIKGGHGLTDNIIGELGTIERVSEIDCKLPYTVNLDALKEWLIPYVFCSEDMLELVKDEKPNTEEPKNVTFRIKAIKDDDEFLTKGKIYEFVDGRTTFDCGMKSSKYKDFEHFIRINKYWENAVVELQDGDNPDEILKSLESGFAKGDEVRVTNCKASYFRYASWKHLGKYAENFVVEGRPSENKIYKVILLGEHGSECYEHERTLALIQDQDTTQVFIMGVEDLELIKKHEVETK